MPTLVTIARVSSHGSHDRDLVATDSPILYPGCIVSYRCKTGLDYGTVTHTATLFDDSDVYRLILAARPVYEVENIYLPMSEKEADHV